MKKIINVIFAIGGCAWIALNIKEIYRSTHESAIKTAKMIDKKYKDK